MNKHEALSRLINYYTDYYKRFTLRPAAQSDAESGVFDSENPHLFTGFGHLLVHLSGLNTHTIKTVLLHYATEAISCTERRRGLHARQPYTPNPMFKHHGLSWDEHNGIMFSCAVHPELRSIVDQIVEYGQRHNWAFIDERPGTDPYAEILSRKRELIRVLWRVLVKREPADKFQLLADLGRIRQYRDRAFYKIISTRHTPSILELMNLAIASILTARTPYEETSGKIQAWGRFKAIEQTQYAKKHRLGGFIIQYSWNIFNRRLLETYGEEYSSKLVKIYYTDPNHPYHILSSNLS